jgi:hypothetical protein
MTPNLPGSDLGTIPKGVDNNGDIDGEGKGPTILPISIPLLINSCRRDES